MIVFDSDQLQVIFRPANSPSAPPYLLITFNTVASTADGDWFFGEPIVRFTGGAALGFMTKAKNWFPQEYMAQAREAISDILSSYPERLLYGYSMGAYGALKYSGLLGSTTAISICPQSSINPEDTRDFDTQYNDLYRKELNGDMRIKPGDATGKFYLFYDNRYKVDVIHASRIAQAIDPILIRVPYTRHETIRCFTGNKVITTLFDLCRLGDDTGVQTFANRRRKGNSIRAYGVGLAALERHPLWSASILYRNASSFNEFGNIEYGTRLGYSALRSNHFECAEAAFAHVLTTQPRHREAFDGLCDVLLRQQKIAQVMSLIREALEVEPTHEPLHQRLTQALMMAGDLDAARAGVEEWLAIAPGSGSAMWRMTEIEDRARRHDQAAAWCRAMIEAEPTNLVLRSRLIHFLILADDLAAAREEALAALNIDACNLTVLQQLSEIAARARDWSDAVGWLRKTTEIAPADAHLRGRLSQLLVHWGHFDEGRAEALLVLDSDPDNLVAMRLLSDIEREAGRFPEAIAWARKAAQRYPDQHYLREHLIDLLIAAGDLEGARVEAEAMIANAPGHLAMMQRLRDIAERTKRLPEAINWARKATEASPAELHLHECLIRLLITADDLVAAQSAAVAALQIAPSHEPVIRLMDDIAGREQGRLRWLDRHHQLVAETMHLAPKILFVGDSIMDHWRTAGRELWERHFLPLGAANIAISGETTRGLLLRLQEGAVEQITPRIVVLMIGTNDLATSRPDEIVHRIGLVVMQLKERLPKSKIMLLGLLPRGAKSASSIQSDIAAINLSIADLASSNAVSFIDTSSYLLEREGWLSVDVSPDGIHLSTEGYRRWFPAILQPIQALIEC